MILPIAQAKERIANYAVDVANRDLKNVHNYTRKIHSYRDLGPFLDHLIIDKYSDGLDYRKFKDVMLKLGVIDDKAALELHRFVSGVSFTFQMDIALAKMDEMSRVNQKIGDDDMLDILDV